MYFMSRVDSVVAFQLKLMRATKDDVKTFDSKKYRKDCPHFLCLEDGTTTRDYKYCEGSLVCQHSGLINGKPVPMTCNYIPVLDVTTNEIEWVEYCTGMYDLRPLKERIEDDMVH
jgi:hypothetical protein